MTVPDTESHWFGSSKYGFGVPSGCNFNCFAKPQSSRNTSPNFPKMTF